MAEPGTTRMIETALRCYPARWRQRHGDEAAELAALLLRDGAPATSIAGSYLAGAAREWLRPRSGRRLGAAACALLIAACSLCAAGMLASAAPARAAGTSQVRTQAPCWAGSSWAVPAVPAATGRLPLIIWEAGHDRSC